MDANGTRFHLLLGERDWATCRDANGPRVALDAQFRRAPATCDSAADSGGFYWDQAHAALTLRPCLVKFEASPNDTPPDPSGADRRGAARDQFGNVYWIAQSTTEIRVIPSGTGAAAHFWSTGDGARCNGDVPYGSFHRADAPATLRPLTFAGLAVTDDHYLVVGVVAPSGVLVFDLHAGGPPQQLLWPADAPSFVPFDLARRPGGGVWMLDRVSRRYWALDRHLTVSTLGHAMDELDPSRRDDFQPVAPAPLRRTAARTFPVGTAIDATDPIAIEGLPDGSVLILDRAVGSHRSHLLRDGIDGRYGAAVALQPFDIDGYDMAFVPADGAGATPAGRLFVASSEGNQARACDLAVDSHGTFTIVLATEYLPMRLFGGKALIAGGAQAFYDFFDGWVPIVAQRRPRYAASASLETPTFDGREPGCVWHRLMLDACIPAEASAHVRSRAGDDEAALASARWQPEPDPYLRRDGSELTGPQAIRPTGRDGTWELLFQNARGRYLQVELTLTANERVTPRVRALRAYYPRFSYLTHYLPAVYREDEGSASFLDRFLANVEGTWTTIEDRIAAAQMLFDVQSAPSGALDWLASWFGIALDPAWSEARRRLFLRHAMDFFRMRGTARGLQTAVRLAIDDCVDDSLFASARPRAGRPDQVRIVETWRTRKMPAVVVGDPTGGIGPRTVAIEARWRPAHSAAVLHARYREWMTAHGIAVATTAEMPLTPPAHTDEAREWRAFTTAVLGFVPSATGADLAKWREFVNRRHPTPKALAMAYGVAVDDLPLLARLPPTGAALADWYDFESRVMALHRTAHHFSVLLPAPRGGDADARRRERLDLVRRVVDLEKPAHTVFDVKFYWALFRLGQARLGEDTLVDRGGRSPDLLPPLRLGQGYVGESHLAPGHPQDVTTRQLLDRDRLTAHSGDEEVRS